jgi:hypothetical protein
MELQGSSPASVWYHPLSRGDGIHAAAMTGPEHYRRAGELAAEARGLLGQGDGQATAGGPGRRGPDPVLALAAATAVGASGADSRAWADAAGTGFGSGRGDH